MWYSMYMKHSPIDYGTAKPVTTNAVPDRTHHWRDIVAHCAALNARDGTDSIVRKKGRWMATSSAAEEIHAAHGSFMMDKRSVSALQAEMDALYSGPKPRGR